jgi:hypothetical protein
VAQAYTPPVGRASSRTAEPAMKSTLQRLCLLAPLALLLAGCDGDDAVSVRIRLREDGSGTMTTSGITIPADPSRVEVGAHGVTFENRVQMSAAVGRFTALTGVTISDIGFSSGEGEGGFRFVKVMVPQGGGALWPDVFVPMDETARLKAAGALDPTGKSKDVGATIKIEIELPAPVIGNGVTGKVRGTKASVEGSTATLVIPVVGARGAPEPLVWHLTWQK